MRFRSSIPILFALAALLATLPASAQPTGRLAGQILDDGGTTLPGVIITVDSASLMGTRTTQTDDEGSFSFPALPPGVYHVLAELDGFIPQENDSIEVRLGRTTEIQFTLVYGEFADEVMVVGETPVIDPEQVSTSQTFQQEYLQKSSVSSLNRGYQNVLGQAAGVTTTTAGGSNPNVYGSTFGENAFYIDGIDSTDPVTATFGINLNFDTIQEINFELGGFEAEYGRATGGVVDVITKSGGNEFHGTFDWRYRDQDFATNGDFFDKNDNKTKFSEPSATLGGPIVRDKVWFFGAADLVDSKRTPTEAPTTRDFQGLNLMGKVTWQVAPQWSMVGRWLDENADIDNANSGQLVAAEATRLQEQPSSISSVEAFGVPTSRTQFSVALAAVRSELNSFPQSRDFDTPGHLDEFGDGTQTVNYTNAQFSKRDRDELKSSFGWFLDDFGGDHEFKVGFEYADLFFKEDNYTVSGFRYGDAFGDPFAYWFEPRPDPAQYDGQLLTGYLQDTWRVNPKLTVKAGLRYDTTAFDNDAGSEIATLDKLQPRFGVAYDLQGDGKTILKGSWGRFMHPNALTLPSFTRTNDLPGFAYLSCSAFGFDRQSCEAIFGGELTAGGVTVSTFIDDPEGFDPNGWLLVSGNIFSSEPSVVADGLSATYADEIILGVEREIMRRTSIGLTYVDKETNDIFEDTCEGNIGNPSPDAGCDFYVMDNLPELRRDYTGWILDFESRYTDWLHLLASYTYSESKGSVEYNQNAGTDFDFFPDHYQNRYGYLSDHAQHRIKVNGYIDLPLGFNLGIDAYWDSAYRYEAREASDIYGEVFLEPRGTRSANDLYRLDLQVAKGFRVGPTNMQVIAAVLNALDDEQVLQVCDRVEGCGSVEIGGSLDYRQPRSYELGFRVEF